MRYHIFVSAAGKTLQKMRRTQTGWRIDELQSVAEENGVAWRNQVTAAATLFSALREFARSYRFLRSDRLSRFTSDSFWR